MQSLSTGAELVVAWLDAETAKRGMEALEDADTCAALCEHYDWQDDEGQLYVDEAYEYYERQRSATWESIVSLMDDDLREAVHCDLDPCSKDAFLTEYCERHREKYGEDFRPAEWWW